MLFITILLALSFLPTIRNIKLMIDGTIDFGSNWNFGDKLKPNWTFEPRKRNPTDLDPQIKYDDVHSIDGIDVNEGKKELVAESGGSVNDKGFLTRMHASDKKDDHTPDDADAKETFVTKLYKTRSKNIAMFEKSHKIEDDAEINKFVNKVYNRSLLMFDKVREDLQGNVNVQKIHELKKRYADKFGKFVNETREHYIKTTFGVKKVIRNTIDYSDKVLNRLSNRFQIDAENTGLRYLHVNKLREAVDELKSKMYSDACTKFNICRVGNEFSDYINDLLTILLSGDDNKIRLAVHAIVKELKSSDFSRIMNKETQRVFREKLTAVEELNNFELRVLLTVYKIAIISRNQPFLNKHPYDRWVEATVAMYHVIETFDKNIEMKRPNEEWSNIKNMLEEWVSNKGGDITGAAKKLVDNIQKEIGTFDDKTAKDIKNEMRLFLLAKALRINLDSYVPFPQI